MIQILNKDQIKKAFKSGEITAFVLKQIKKYVTPGITTLELEKIASRIIFSRGAKPAFVGVNGYKFASCISINEEVVHTFPSSRIIKNGDIVSFDIGVDFEGINSDAAATFVAGEYLTENSKRLVEGTKDALKSAIHEVRAGVRLGNIEAAIGESLKSHGLSPVMSLSGHGIGEKVHQDPPIMCDGEAGTGPIIPEDTLLAIEPMATLGSGEVEPLDGGWRVVSKDRTLGAHFEHTVLVTENGSKILTQYE